MWVKVSMKLSPVQILWAHFYIGDETSSALDFARSSLSVSTVSTCFSRSTIHVDIALIVAPVSNINCFNCLFSKLNRFNSSNMRSRFVSTLSPRARRLLLSAARQKKLLRTTPISGAKLPVAKSLSDSILDHELDASSSSRQESWEPRPHCLSPLCDPLDPLSDGFLVLIGERVLFCATLEFRLRCARSVKIQMDWENWTK